MLLFVLNIFCPLEYIVFSCGIATHNSDSLKIWWSETKTKEKSICHRIEIIVYTHLIIKCIVTDKQEHTLRFERECGYSGLQWMSAQVPLCKGFSGVNRRKNCRNLTFLWWNTVGSITRPYIHKRRTYARTHELIPMRALWNI